MKHITQEEFDLVLTQNPSNEDLKYLIRWTDLKEEAQEILDSRPKNMMDVIRDR